MTNYFANRSHHEGPCVVPICKTNRGLRNGFQRFLVSVSCYWKTRMFLAYPSVSVSEPDALNHSGVPEVAVQSVENDACPMLWYGV